ncbi:YicC family protein [Dissulfurispira thermophila]|uniref:YicC family protein n=1 Tax=Dissulfurispira thermophila TaxID=2715679 RepID=A0A7G1H4S0_9BACT|nr:YicC/YloC family endoribonuclease [Dissulfurispira thermophila]BCB97209.1 YicC family protein [Dissulfurispira thermophila]
MQSMTGFGAAERDGFKVEIRSLNHRYIEISVRMPSAMVEHEMSIRNIIKERFVRGKIDVNISPSDKRQTKVVINKELARGIYDAFSDLQKELSLTGAITIDFFSSYRELLITEDLQCDKDALYIALNEAISKLEGMRRTEGEALKTEMQYSLKKLTDMHNEIERLSSGLAPRYREALSKKIAELVSNLSIDETRLAQEVAIMAQKSDISEELARFHSHLQQFQSALSDGEVIGRKLDFILQEMNRETNTIASKMDDIKIINLTIDMKTEIEKLREQVQNIQ